jgi:UDP-2,3-diacylglucosamine pyrophosphatase LpxH
LPLTLNVDFPLATLKHDRYYLIDDESRSLEIVFSDAIIPETAEDAINFSDKSGSLKEYYDIVVSGKVAFIRFKPDYKLKGGWSYNLLINEGILSVNGYTISPDMEYNFRTTSVHIHENHSANSNDSSSRTLIAVISDIHCGDQRATNKNYSWFHENSDALKQFTGYIKDHPGIRQLVIQGDLFDEWMIPYYVKPFDTSVNISSSKEYFKAIADNVVNKPVFDNIRAILNEQKIDVIYIPGNHDMLITNEILQEILPGILYKGDIKGLGYYEPVDKILMEHGHRYDFFNCPQPLVNEGHILPPGYFVTRLYASGLASRKANKSASSQLSDIEFVTAWSLAFGYTISNFNLNADTIPMDSLMVQMSGVNGYSDPFSFDGALGMYDKNIEELWPSTQTLNNIPKPMSVFLAILNGKYLYGAALYEYLTDYFSEQPRIVSWGHSHEPDIKVFPFQSYYTGIYANSGSWIDPSESSYKTRTFLIINPGKWSGSELDVVSLYQFNKDNDAYLPYLLKEENIKKD